MCDDTASGSAAAGSASKLSPFPETRRDNMSNLRFDGDKLVVHSATINETRELSILGQCESKFVSEIRNERIRLGVSLAICSFYYSDLNWIDRSIDYLEIIKIALLYSVLVILKLPEIPRSEILMRYRIERATTIDSAASIVPFEIFPSTNCFRYKCG